MINFDARPSISKEECLENAFDPVDLKSSASFSDMENYLEKEDVDAIKRAERMYKETQKNLPGVTHNVDYEYTKPFPDLPIPGMHASS